MQNFGKVKLFGMVAIITGALIFVGINFLDAQVQILEKKASLAQQEAIWTVTIPGSLTLEGSSCNLYGLPDTEGDNTYEDEHDRVYVSVEKKKGGKEYLLRLIIWYSISVQEEGENRWAECIEGPKVGFQNVALTQVGDIVPYEYPCFFPNYKEFTASLNGTGDCYPCDNPEAAANLIPLVMQHFLNTYPQPYCNTLCDIYDCPSCPRNCIFRYVDIRITVDHNIEKMELGASATPTAQVWIEVVNNFDLQTGCEDWHNVSGLLQRDDSTGCITITRSDTDTWEIIINTEGNPLFTFIEIYKGYWKKRWEYKIPYWTKTPFKFITTWSKSPTTPDTYHPVVTITNPDDGSTFESGDPIQFEGTASDSEDDDLSSGLVWTSSIDDQIGTGRNFSATLSDGVHTIAATVTDSDGKTGSDSIEITVGTPPEPDTIGVASINYSTKGGKNGDKHLVITCTLDPTIAGATVSIDLYRDNNKVDSFTGTTDSNGQVTFTHSNAKSGYYTSTVTDVTAAGWYWDGVTPPNEFQK